MKAENELRELVKSPEKKKALIKYVEGISAWQTTFTSEEQSRILRVLVDFLEEKGMTKDKKKAK